MAKQMTKYAAWRKATDLWGVPKGGWNYSEGFVRIRRKNVELRYEVGYLKVNPQAPAPQGNFIYVILGKGKSWEQAFEKASLNPEAP